VNRDIDQYIERARQQVRQNNTHGAIESLRMALTIDPEHAYAHAWLAICLHDQKRIYAARYEAEQGLLLEPESAFTHYAMASVLTAMRRFNQAESHLRRCIELEPGHAEYWRSYANLNNLWGKDKDVLPMLEKARDMDPDDPDIWADMARYHYFQKSNLALAEQCARNALQLQADHLNSLVMMGFILLHQGQIEAARDHALWALRQDPSDEFALNLFCSIKARKSLFLGLWWRINKFVGAGTITRMVLILIGSFAVYRFAVMLLGDYGHADMQTALKFAWLGLCIYTWVGPQVFARQLQKELKTVKLDSRY
jgi:tetratricopeptide (TPR) repeat protein